MTNFETRTETVVMLIQPGQNPEIVVNAVKPAFPNLVVIEEQPESKKLFIIRRAKKLGWVQALGQLATMVVSKYGKRFTTKRAEEIREQFGLSATLDSTIPRIAVSSANSPELLKILADMRPSALLLFSCRMLKGETLAAISCPVLNFHAGINPQYRGLQGGYWSRIERDEENFGGTVHLVDAGVDTGDTLYQQRIRPSKRDTMHTYPLLQTAASTGIIVKALEDAVTGNLKPLKIAAPSRQWYHPPIWTWIWNGATRGIW
ncbi:formyl transferase [Shinella curvata]|uniref:Formyl transferase n=1 Tax=Shinella curvata TaxID=1817964 RepID=A0ABT8X8L9_9HYPH|nr:formyl transferase [Shinella curvata]MCJ8052242.1 formyl transferase [Shinella curvata]MDO6119809.1 formyl transferase [Shinella curvata]